MMDQICIVVASNDEDCLRRNQLASEMIIRHNVPLQIERNAPSAAVAYNRALDATTAPIVIFAHQDVYFPPGWEQHLAAVLHQLDGIDPRWAVLAPFGVSDQAELVGDVWTTSLSSRIGKPLLNPVAAQSFDEMVIILRRDSGLRFDENLPLFHLYGTDIVQTARSAGLGAYVGNLPVVHNDGFHDRLRRDFSAGYAFVRRKWQARLPLRTPVVWVTWHGLSLPLYRLRAARSIERRRAVAGNTGTDPRIFAARCGWEAAQTGVPE